MATLPIRIREILRPDGTRVRELLVFCPREGASIKPEKCARCGFRCPPENQTLAPAVGCGAVLPGDSEGPSDGLLSGRHAAATRVHVGAASAQVFVCFRVDVPLRVAHRALDATRRWVAPPVVDSDGVLLGVLPTPASGVSDPRLPFMTAGDAMIPSFAVLESESLLELISTMTSHHLREVPIVDSARRVTGTLCDLEILRWVARGAPEGWR